MYNYAENTIYLNVKAGKDSVSVKVEDDLLFVLLGRIKSNLIIDEYNMSPVSTGNICGTYEFIEFLTKTAKPRKYSYQTIENGEETVKDISTTDVANRIVYINFLVVNVCVTLETLIKDSEKGIITVKLTQHQDKVLRSLWKSYKEFFIRLNNLIQQMNIAPSVIEQIKFREKDNLKKELRIFKVKGVTVDVRIVEYSKMLENSTTEILKLLDIATDLGDEQIKTDLESIRSAMQFKR